jgi:hypothetical protein
MSESVPITFELVARAVSASSWTNCLTCPTCKVRLNLHQPDEEQPAQLLGTCESCSRWFFLVEREADLEETLLFELPSADMIRALAVPATTC